MLLKLDAIRQINTTSILKYIIDKQPLSRIDISEQMGMNKATISQITRDLINSNIINEVGMGSSTALGGRKPVLLTFNHKIGVSLGIDIGVNSIRFLVTYLNGEVIYKDIKIHDHDKTIKIITDFIHAQEIIYSDLLYGVVGVTISIQGIVHEDEIFFIPNYDVTGIERIANDFDFPIHFENEANLAAFAHTSINNVQSNSIAAVTLRSGIGSGIVHNKVIYKGFQSRSGELGHTIVVPNGIKCTCGNKGCLEQYVSEGAILKQFNSEMHNKDLTIHDLVNEFKKGNEIAINIIESTSELLAIGINNFIALFAINEIYLVANLSDEMETLPESIKNKITSVFSKDISLKNSPFGKYASSTGACLVGIDRFINDLIV